MWAKQNLSWFTNTMTATFHEERFGPNKVAWPHHFLFKCLYQARNVRCHVFACSGADPGFQVRGRVHLKKLGYFVWKIIYFFQFFPLCQSSTPVHVKVYSIQHYVIKFVSDLRQVGGFLRVLWFPPPIKLTAMI